ncbi:MAG TPA: hypothetical protein VFQ76_20730, partial [Longimicrobiaceae bacterium]|nr:hypothetical protein [Longimicrobiaceae bacterium]
MEALRCLAATYGTSVSQVGSDELVEAPSPRDGDEQVVGLGADGAALAPLYAHLTGRSWSVADDERSLRALPAPTVVVTSARFLSSTLLDQLYPHESGDPAPGLVFGHTFEELRREVLVRSAAAGLRGPLTLRSAEFYALSRAEPVHTPARRVLSGEVTAAEVRARASADAGVLTVVTHSDGIDAYAAGDLTVCRMDRPTLFVDRRRPYCLETGVCFRHGMPVEDFVRSGRMLSPDEFRCRVLVWGTCYGLLCEDGTLDPCSSLLARFLANPRIGAIATSWGAVMLNRRVLSPLVEALARGTNLGDALGFFHRSALARTLGVRLCLLGDPRAALPRARPQDRAMRPATRAPRREADGVDWGELTFLRAYLGHATLSAVGTLQRLGQAALEAVTVYEYLALRGLRLEGEESAAGPSLRRAVIEFLTRRGPVISIDWGALTANVRSLPRSACPSCGLAVAATVHRLRVPNASPRRLRSCPRCGVVEDAPVRSDL